MSTSTVTLTGWGRIAPSAAELAAPANEAEAAALLRQPRAPGGAVIPRGLGRSYNNAAQSAGGLVLSTSRLNRIISLDQETGLAVCEAGVQSLNSGKAVEVQIVDPASIKGLGT